MGPRRLSNLTYAATCAGALLSVAVLLSATAQAATIQQKVYSIFIAEYRAELRYTQGQMHADLTSAQKQLATSASSIDALSSTNQTAATALVDELENQYDAVGAKPLLRASRKAFTALVKLPLTHTEHREAVTDLAYVKRALSINTAADLAHWRAAGYTAASEPADTKTFGGVVGLSLPSISLPVSGTNAAVKTFVRFENRSSAKTRAVFTKVGSDWGTWVARFGIQAG
jgi:basic membrane lipoprotein Med (substrate-binding protein (PBP1-ABC) superfamily)